MRDYRDAKAMAHSLREALTHKAIAVSHSECLELIAKSFGVDTWNILSAKIEAAQPVSNLVAADTSGGKTCYCSFCGKSQHDVTMLIAGPTVFICNECISLCDEIVDDFHVGDLLKRDPAEARRFLGARSQDQLAAFIEGCEKTIARLTRSNQQIRDHLAKRAAGKASPAAPLGAKTAEDLAEQIAKAEKSIAIAERSRALAQEILSSRNN